MLFLLLLLLLNALLTPSLTLDESSRRHLAQQQDCSKISSCEPGVSFCDFAYGNQGRCQPCSLDSCFVVKQKESGNLELTTAGTVDCFDSCGLVGTTPTASTITDTLCHAYIVDYDTFIPSTGPFPLPCDNPWGTWGPGEHQQSSCCHVRGRYFVGTGQIGGFDATYGSPNHFLICSAYVSALQHVLCDPKQGQYIRTNATNGENVVRICRSSCDAVLANCGLPGEVFPDWTNYADGTSLCQELWGGFGYTPCESRPEGYPCQARLSIQVLDEDCLDMVFPSNEVLEHIKSQGYAPESEFCQDSGSSSTVVIIIAVCVAAFVVVVFLFLVLFGRGRRKQRSAAAAQEGVYDNTNGDVVETVAVKVRNDKPRAPVMMEELEAPPPMVEAIAISSSIQESPVKALAPPVPAPPTSSIPKALSIGEYVEKSNDKKDSVKEWIANNPAAAGLLTPLDVATVLSKISFSLDHPEVAKLVVMGIQQNGGSVTCAHIVAAIEQCPFQDADIAKEMAPYVNDVENKDQVLQKLRNSFDKNAVSKLFQ